VEIAPGIGLADGICDIVGTGSTLFSNGLKEVEVILRSEAVMIAQSDLSDEKQEIVDRILFRIRSVSDARKHRYILLNAPNEALAAITDILPGIKSPTITPLAREGWSSLHSVVHLDEFWDMINNLKQAGAEGILVIPIETMVG
jgi:ATP phosphoribosyltransferase